MKKIVLFLIILLLALPIQAGSQQKLNIKKIGNVIAEGISRKILKMPFVVTGALNMGEHGEFRIKLVIKVPL